MQDKDRSWGSFQIDKQRNAEFGNIKDLRTVTSFPSRKKRGSGSAYRACSEPVEEPWMGADTESATGAGQSSRRAVSPWAPAKGAASYLGDCSPTGGVF